MNSKPMQAIPRVFLELVRPCHFHFAGRLRSRIGKEDGRRAGTRGAPWHK